MYVRKDPFVALSKTRKKKREFPISTHSTVSHTHTHTLAFACACVCIIDWLSNKETKTHRETDCARPFVLFIVVTVSAASLLHLLRLLEKAYTFLIKRMRATELEICMRTRMCVCIACFCMFCGGNMIKCVIKENVSLAEKKIFISERKRRLFYIITNIF